MRFFYSFLGAIFSTVALGTILVGASIAGVWCYAYYHTYYHTYERKYYHTYFHTYYHVVGRVAMCENDE